MISATIIPSEIKQEIFNKGLQKGKESKDQGLGIDDWPGDFHPSIRKYAKKAFHESNQNKRVNSIEIYESEPFEEIEDELEDVFIKGYRKAFE